MVKKNFKLFDFFRTLWPFLVIIIIIFFFFIDIILAIWITFIFLIISLLVYLPSLSFKSRLVNLMNKHLKIEDIEISHKAGKVIEEIREYMHELSLKQKNRDWLIVHLNNRYIYYNAETIKAYTQLYYRGYTDKQIFDNMNDLVKLKTRSEVKAIENTLKLHDRLVKRDIIMEKKPIRIDKYHQNLKKLGKT
ncbi:MAG: hypothetical protein ACFFBP_06345 [Promethearchaeota archaeon]